MSEPKNRGGRPPSRNPRSFPVLVKLTESERVAAEHAALVEGTSVSDILRRGIARPLHASTLAPQISRRA